MNKFKVLSFWTIDFDAVFDDLFVNLFAFTKLWGICNSNDKNLSRNIWVQKIPLFKMANSPVKNVRAEKTGSTNWSKMRWFSFQKIDLHLVHWNPCPNRAIFRDIRSQYILRVKNEAQRSTNTITKMAPPLMFSWIFCASINHRTKLKWQALWSSFDFILVAFFPKIITFRLFRTSFWEIQADGTMKIF